MPGHKSASAICLLLLLFMGQGVPQKSLGAENPQNNESEEMISPQDWEIIENLDLLENLDMLQDEDVSFWEEYEYINEFKESSNGNNQDPTKTNG